MVTFIVLAHAAVYLKTLLKVHALLFQAESSFRS